MMFRATISSPSILVNSISTIAELIDEGNFKVTKDGISFLAADRAMVAVVDWMLAASAFDSFQVDKDDKIGLNISNLLSVLKRASSNDKLTLNLLDSKLEVTIEGSSRRRFVIPLLDLSQEEVPPVSQLEFTATAQVKPDIIQSGIDDADIISDSVLFETSPEKFVMRAEGDISKAELELEKGNPSLMSLQSNGSVKSRYPLEYLKKMIKAARIADDMQIKMGQDYPMKLEFKSGDKCSLSFVLAPRVSD